MAHGVRTLQVLAILTAEAEPPGLVAGAWRRVAGKEKGRGEAMQVQTGQEDQCGESEGELLATL